MMIDHDAQASLPPGSVPLTAVSPDRMADDCLYIKGYIVPRELLPQPGEARLDPDLLDTLIRS